MGRYSKGYKPSPPDKVGLGHPPRHLMAVGALPTAVSWRGRIVEVLNQLSTSSCVPHAVTQQIRAAMVAQGLISPPLPSRLFTYFAARCESGDQFEDSGTYVHSAYAALSAVGFPPESAWTFTDDPAKVNAQPEWEAFREAADQRWLSGYFRIGSTGSQRVQDVKAALAAGHCVTLGTSVDQAFEDLAVGAVWPGCGPNPLGGHCLLAVGYRPGAIELCNSWSSSWCDGGFCLISEAALAASYTEDLWVATVAPTFSEAA